MTTSTLQVPRRSPARLQRPKAARRGLLAAEPGGRPRSPGLAAPARPLRPRRRLCLISRARSRGRLTARPAGRAPRPLRAAGAPVPPRCSRSQASRAPPPGAWPGPGAAVTPSSSSCAGPWKPRGPLRTSSGAFRGPRPPLLGRRPFTESLDCAGRCWGGAAGASDRPLLQVPTVLHGQKTQTCSGLRQGFASQPSTHWQVTLG